MLSANSDLQVFAPRIAKGDKSALSEFYSQTVEATHARMLALFGESEAARDCTKATYVWLWKLRHGLSSSQGDLATWFTLLVNKVAALHCDRWAGEGSRIGTKRVARLDARQLAACLGLDTGEVPHHLISLLDRIGEGDAVG